MKIIPAIDIRCGEFVVFIPNQEIKEKFMHNSPLEIARHWESKGAEDIYITDYDGLFKSIPQNLEVVEEIKKNTGCRIYYSGGVCTAFDLERAFDAGTDMVIINISNFRKRLTEDELFTKYIKRIIVGIDVKDGALAVEGFNNPINLDLELHLPQLYAKGLEKVIVTDITKRKPGDKTFMKRVINLSDKIGYKIIVSGGITSVADIENLRTASSSEFEAVVLGRSLYTGKIKYNREVDFSLLV